MGYWPANSPETLQNTDLIQDWLGLFYIQIYQDFLQNTSLHNPPWKFEIHPGVPSEYH